MQTHTEITGDHWALHELHRILAPGHQLTLSAECRQRIQDSRVSIETATGKGQAIYGVNTGFGSLYHVRISDEATERLQTNLIRSHAAGAGAVVPYEIARLTLFLKIISFCHGHSGVRLELVEKLVALFNAGLAPAMAVFGSLGASGDLAPLAHLALNTIGEGECVDVNGEVSECASVLEELGIEPLTLKSKEGLALINGTQFSAAYAAWAVLRARRLIDVGNVCGALSLDAFNGNLQAFDARIQQIRPHQGQIRTAAMIRSLLKGSEIAHEGEKQLQDPYAFRCIPQVHGASWDVMSHCTRVIETEINSVTDNPLVFPGSDEVLSGGNFHGQPVALAMDYLAIALAEIGSISERRTYQLLTGQRGLPDYLTMDAGVQSGLMIAQYTAASIVNRNKILCTPASIDTIPTSKGQEDHVSMSANAASKLYELCENVQTILAIEFLAAARALEFRLPAKTSARLEQFRQGFGQAIRPGEEDQVLYPVIRHAKVYLSGINVDDLVE